MRTFVVFVLLVFVSAARAAQPAGYFADHMVLQREQPIVVWGSAAPGAPVSVTLDESKAQATADDSGQWSATLPAMAAGGPYVLAVSDAGGATRFTDVMVGEVWFCGGQSNMMWPVYLCDNARAEIDSADHPWLRLARADHAYADEPRGDVGVRWWVCSPETVANFGAAAYYFGKQLEDRGCTVAVVDVAWGGSSVEAWMSRGALEALPELAPRLAYADRIRADYEQNKAAFEAARAAHAGNVAAAAQRGAPAAFAPTGDYRTYQHHWPCGLYNSIIHPLRHARFRGIVFYQGETNAERAAQYRTLFPAMIRDWRATFEQGDFPFIYVQLAGFKFTEEEPQASAWAELREAQTLALSEPDTAMVLTIDIGDRRYIHPTNKQELGRRMALAARKLAYGEDVVARGPHVREVTFEGGAAVVTFDGADGGDLLMQGDPFKAFAVAGEDQRFWWATVTIEGDRVTLKSPMVDRPVAVRYNWADYPVTYLYNAAGLPAEPFRSDDWPGLTDGRW